MSIKLPCEIVRDLLPSYIDGLANKVTKEAVNEHLNECQECNDIYAAMKEECEKEILPEVESSDDPVIFHKIKKKLNRKVKIAIWAGVGVLLVTVLAFELLFNAVIREIPRDEVEVSVTVYPMQDIATLASDTQNEIGLSLDSDKMVTISCSDEGDETVDGDPSFTIQIPDFPNSSLAVSQDIMDRYDTLTLIKWKSPYFLRAILWEIEEVDGERIMYIKHYRSTILKSRESNSGSYTTSIEFGELSKIIYLEKDGTQTVLWENR